MLHLTLAIGGCLVILPLLEHPPRRNRRRRRTAALALGWLGLLTAWGILEDGVPSFRTFGGTALVRAEDPPPVDQAQVPAETVKVPAESAPAVAERDDEAVPSASGTPAGAEHASPLTDYSAVIDYEKRPAWVESEPTETGPIHKYAVSSGPYQRKQDCRKQLYQELKTATDEYVRNYLRSPQAAAAVNVDERYIRSKLVAATFDEIVQSPSFGPMHQMHALLEFDDGFRHQLDERWREVQVKARLWQGGLVAASILVVLTVLLSYFKLDTATRGFYTGRLKFVTVVAILAVIALAALFVR